MQSLWLHPDTNELCSAKFQLTPLLGDLAAVRCLTVATLAHLTLLDQLVHTVQATGVCGRLHFGTSRLSRLCLSGCTLMAIFCNGAVPHGGNAGAPGQQPCNGGRPQAGGQLDRCVHTVRARGRTSSCQTPSQHYALSDTGHPCCGRRRDRHPQLVRLMRIGRHGFAHVHLEQRISGG